MVVAVNPDTLPDTVQPKSLFHLGPVPFNRHSHPRGPLAVRGFAALLVFLGSLALASTAFGQNPGFKLNSGDILYVDAGNAVDGGFLIKVDPISHQQTVLSSGGLLQLPVATADGNFGIGLIVRVDGQTGLQTVVATGGYLAGPVGIAMDANGQLIVADPYTVNPQSPDLVDGGYDGALIRIDPATGAQTLLARGQDGYVNARGVTVVPNPKH